MNITSIWAPFLLTDLAVRQVEAELFGSHKSRSLFFYFYLLDDWLESVKHLSLIARGSGAGRHFCNGSVCVNGMAGLCARRWADGVKQYDIRMGGFSINFKWA